MKGVPLFSVCRVPHSAGVKRARLQGSALPSLSPLLLQSESYQEDIYPPTAAAQPSLTAHEWLSGINRGEGGGGGGTGHYLEKWESQRSQAAEGRGPCQPAPGNCLNKMPGKQASPTLFLNSSWLEMSVTPQKNCHCDYTEYLGGSSTFLPTLTISSMIILWPKIL